MTATFFNRIFTYYHFITFLLQDIKFDLDFYRRALLLKLKASTTALKLFLSKAKASELFYPKQRPLNFLIQSKGDRTFFYPNQRLLNFFIQSKGFWTFLSKTKASDFFNQTFFIQSKLFWTLFLQNKGFWTFYQMQYSEILLSIFYPK